EAANTLAHLGEFDARRARGPWHQALFGQPGQRVGLQAKDVAVGAGAEVDARITAQLQGAVRRERQLLQVPGLARVDLRREDLFRHPRRVLALVVEDFV